MPGAGKPACATVTRASDSRTLTMRAHERSGLLQHWRQYRVRPDTLAELTARLLRWRAPTDFISRLGPG
ncbi:hypothetical protein CJO79_18960 (plasmid) [Ralstonia solanacearum]|nr:hypothetical protein CJO76_18975 [Ralstonia solanacearum]AXV93084.1 hypothetical protein CJO79_18960 [Ralstonia solanacearum]AXW21138.1 hypothetical protein CJO85_19025 [Ralstonia solanacearum]AXW77982.1 hypothetical protein CJO97_18955 [Ralstonia solanacearum]